MKITDNKIKQSESIIIKRSKINFAPYNPRKEDKKVVEELKKNFKRVGFLGGICWNETTGNLVGGHKRLQALDLIYKYNGTIDTDYDVKVEKIIIDEKTEKEQNIFLNNKNVQGENDLEKLAFILPDINIDFAKLENQDIELIKYSVPDFKFGNNDEFKNDIENLKKEKKFSKEEIKNIKKINKDSATKVQENLFFTITFKTLEEKSEFLEYLNINSDIKFITFTNFMNKLNEI